MKGQIILRNIVITGFMASGKTTVSKELKRVTGMELADTDELIEKSENKTVNRIFSENGEAYFRDREKEFSHKLSEMDGMIISTGGGFVLNPDNINNLRKNGVVFFLDTDFSIIEKRIYKAAQTRPLMRNSSIEEIRQRYIGRLQFYDNCDYKIKVFENDTPKTLAKKILSIYNEE